MKKRNQMTILIPIADVIENAQVPAHMSCDWWPRDPLAFGLVIFPLVVYRKMEELKHVQHSSS